MSGAKNLSIDAERVHHMRNLTRLAPRYWPSTPSEGVMPMPDAKSSNCEMMSCARMGNGQYGIERGVGHGFHGGSSVYACEKSCAMVKGEV
jgi:hypothetical protein